MKSKVQLIFFALCLALLLPLAGFATENIPKDDEGSQQAQEAQAAKEDSLGLYADENKVNEPFMLEDQMLSSQEQFNVENSPASVPASTTKEAERQEEEESNSAMSFNFIYYIIDKFKLADPIMD